MAAGCEEPKRPPAAVDVVVVPKPIKYNKTQLLQVIQVSMNKIQGLLKASSTVFRDLMIMLMKILIKVLKVYFRNAGPR